MSSSRNSRRQQSKQEQRKRRGPGQHLAPSKPRRKVFHLAQNTALIWMKPGGSSPQGVHFGGMFNLVLGKDIIPLILAEGGVGANTEKSSPYNWSCTTCGHGG